MSGTPLIITADDYGLTDATSRAIVDAHREGIVTATSVLAVVPDLDHRMRWLDDAPDLAVGVHLALVGEDPPLLGASEIPTLVDRRGAFAASWRTFLARAGTGRIDPADVERELAAQVDAVSGHRPVDHLDTHQHTHLWPMVGRVVIGLAVARGIPRVRVPRSGRCTPSGLGVDRLASRLDAAVGAAGLRRTARFRGLDEAGHWDEARLVGALTDLASGTGSVEINLHPGTETDASRSRYAWDYAWGSELAALQSSAVRRAVDDLGFTLAGR
ncbi:MAG: YdjC family protein [Ilumatobacteraceae bacterium]|nr:YdjC family protein [Ilumatobacteraceae bacterium]